MDALQIFFLVLSAIMVFAASQVVTSNNLVHSALWLIVTFFGAAIAFVLLEAGFFAAVQVVVYIGAIAILIIFAIMLTRRVMTDNTPQTNRLWPVAAVVGIALFFGITTTLSLVPFGVSNAPVPADELARMGVALTDPNQFAVPFMLTGVLLLAAMIGAITVARDDQA